MGEERRERISCRNVDITGGFWQEKQKLFREVTVDAVYDRFEETGRFEALNCAWKEGMPNRPHIFWDSDVAKWIEGAAYFLLKQRDEELEARVDELIDRMEKHQWEDGYLNSYFTTVEPEERFQRRTDHELYCAGHLAEAAVAYAQATGKRKLLEIVEKYMALIDRVFRQEHSAAFDTPGHEEIELALYRLYEYTGKECYRRLAEYFVDTRGTSSRDETYDFTDQEHMQSHLPVRQQKTAEGHSVRALYLYCAMADQARIDKDGEMARVCETLFENITRKRMYITGGVGSTHRGESFTFDYDLPEYTAYNETCASIALAMFCRRMWLLEADGKYADCAERAIYNTVLSGVSLSGDRFFYENPLSADPVRNAFNVSRAKGLQEHLPILSRVKVFDCSCCPPNLLRFVGSIADYMYSVSGNTIYAHCYMDAQGEMETSGGRMKLKQETGYPYDGKIRILTETEATCEIALHLPSWAEQWKLTINGKEAEAVLRKGYLYVQREWKCGDCLELELDMGIRFWESNPRVIDTSGRIAVTRGPLVFCAEGIDNEDLLLRDVRVKPMQEGKICFRQMEGTTLPVLELDAEAREEEADLYVKPGKSLRNVKLHLIPYFAWANRQVTSMNTWFLEE